MCVPLAPFLHQKERYFAHFYASLPPPTRIPR